MLRITLWFTIQHFLLTHCTWPKLRGINQQCDDFLCFWNQVELTSQNVRCDFCLSGLHKPLHNQKWPKVSLGAKTKCLPLYVFLIWSVIYQLYQYMCTDIYALWSAKFHGVLSQYTLADYNFYNMSTYVYLHSCFTGFTFSRWLNPKRLREVLPKDLYYHRDLNASLPHRRPHYMIQLIFNTTAAVSLSPMC